MIQNLFSRKCPKTTAIVVVWCGGGTLLCAAECCQDRATLQHTALVPASSFQPCTMSGFSEATLSQKLAELNQTAPSIQGVSLWLLHHRKHYQTYVKVRNEETS